MSRPDAGGPRHPLADPAHDPGGALSDRSFPPARIPGKDSPASRPSTPLEEASQDDRVVVIFVVRRVDQGHCAPRRPAREIPERCASRRGLQLSPIAEGELSPAPRIMRKPAAQGVTRRDVLGPRVERKVLLSNAAGPEPIDEHPVAVPARGRLIRALDPDHGTPSARPWRPRAAPVDAPRPRARITV